MISYCQLRGHKIVNSLQSGLFGQEEEVKRETHRSWPSEKETFLKWWNVNSTNTVFISTGLKLWSTFEDKSQRSWNRTDFLPPSRAAPYITWWLRGKCVESQLPLHPSLLTLGFQSISKRSLPTQWEMKPVSLLPLLTFALYSMGLLTANGS